MHSKDYVFPMGMLHVTGRDCFMTFKEFPLVARPSTRRNAAAALRHLRRFKRQARN